VSDLPTLVLVAVSLSKTLITHTVHGITSQKTTVFIIVATFSSTYTIVTFELIAEFLNVWYECCTTRSQFDFLKFFLSIKNKNFAAIETAEAEVTHHLI